MSEVIYAMIVLSIPFLLGVLVGIEIVKRRPKSTNELLGEIVRSRIVLIHEKGRWLETGSGYQVRSTFDVPFDSGRTIQIIVKEVA